MPVEVICLDEEGQDVEIYGVHADDIISPLASDRPGLDARATVVAFCSRDTSAEMQQVLFKKVETLFPGRPVVLVPPSVRTILVYGERSGKPVSRKYRVLPCHPLHSEFDCPVYGKNTLVGIVPVMQWRPDMFLLTYLEHDLEQVNQSNVDSVGEAVFSRYGDSVRGKYVGFLPYGVRLGMVRFERDGKSTPAKKKRIR